MVKLGFTHPNDDMMMILIFSKEPVDEWMNAESTTVDADCKKTKRSTQKVLFKLLFLLPLQAALQPTSTPAPPFYAVSDLISVISVFAADLPASAFPWRHVEGHRAPRKEPHRWT